MSRTVLITGASGSIGNLLRKHFATLGWQLLLLDRSQKDVVHDRDVMTAELSVFDESWVRRFSGVDAVVHLAADPSPEASWESVQKNNISTLENVIHASRRYNVRRVVFTSSNWVMAGYRFEGTGRLSTDMPPKPVNPYGVSKLVGERIGAAAEGLSFIALRIGYSRSEHGPEMENGTWGQLMWVSDRDLCNGMERAIVADNVKFAVLNMMSDNPGMRWDIETTKQVIGYAPRDGERLIAAPQVLKAEALVREQYERLPISHLKLT